jgi:uncharacterized SAM-binding protein YcdF (DUF218 family)
MPPTPDQKRRLIWLRWIALAMALLLVGIILAVAFPERVMCVDSGAVQADALVVLGGGGGERPRRAAELFAKGAAPVIIVSGFGDCESNRRQLIAAGVPADAIVLESESRTTQENAQFTVRMLRVKMVEDREQRTADGEQKDGSTSYPVLLPVDAERIGRQDEWQASESTQNLQPTTAVETPPLRVILVTSWYHSRRALSCFEHYGPEMQFYSRPSYYGYPRWKSRPGVDAAIGVSTGNVQPSELASERRAVASYVRSEYIKLLGYWVRHGIAPW